MDQESVLNHYFIPLQQEEGQNKIIAILDCSGSMSSYWQYVAINYNEILNQVQSANTITFDTNVKVFLEKEQIQSNINHYGGGGTDITKPFVELNKLIDSHNIKENLTVLFVSDGQGSYDEKQIKSSLKKVENLNFICIGVGNGFPTHISMSLRSLYHTGNLSIPPIFIVDVNSKELTKMNRVEYIKNIFEVEFKSVQQLLTLRKKVNTSLCYVFPWEQQQVENVWSGSWVCNYADQLLLNEKIIHPVEPSVDMITNLAQYWLQNIQLLSLKQQTQDFAQKAYQELQRIENLIPKANKKQQVKKTVAQRLKEHQNKEAKDYDILLQELKEFTKGFSLQQLNDKDAADRLKIGSKVGKFHQKALKFAGLTVEDFTKARDEFLVCLKENKFEGDDGDRSLLTLQSQKEILQEQDLQIGLQNCFSQYALVTAFPIIGYGLYIHRSNASMIDPYKIQVVSLVRIHKFIDSVSLIEAQDHELKFKIGDDEEEKINCILPIYTKEKNQDLIPFFRSQLFHTIMTFVVCENADVCFDYSYAALLSNTLYYLIQQPHSEWQQEMIQLIIESYQLAYEKRHNSFNKKLIEIPAQALVDVNTTYDTICQDTLKGILSLASLKSKLPLEKVKEINDRIILESVGRCLKDVSTEQHINLFFNLEQENVVLQQLIDEITDDFDEPRLKECKSMSAVTKQVLEEVEKVQRQQWKLQYQFNKDQFIQMLKQTKFKFENLQRLNEYFLNEEISQDYLVALVFHARYIKSLERAQNALLLDMQEITEEMTKIKVKLLQTSLLDKCKKVVIEKTQKYGISAGFVQRLPGFGISRRRRRRPNVNRQKQN